MFKRQLFFGYANARKIFLIYGWIQALCRHRFLSTLVINAVLKNMVYEIVIYCFICILNESSHIPVSYPISFSCYLIWCWVHWSKIIWFKYFLEKGPTFVGILIIIIKASSINTNSWKVIDDEGPPTFMKGAPTGGKGSRWNAKKCIV